MFDLARLQLPNQLTMHGVHVVNRVCGRPPVCRLLPASRKLIIQGLSSNLDLCRTLSDDAPRLQCFVSDLHQG
jgi:hypothetical protein